MKLTKTISYSVLFLVFTLFAVTPLCTAATTNDKTSLEEVKQESKDLIQALKGYSVAQREEAAAKIKVTLGHLDQRINDLEITIGNKWDKMDTSAREKARASLAELRRERTEVAEFYGSLKSSSADAWEDLKKVFSDAYISLNETWERSEIEIGRSK